MSRINWKKYSKEDRKFLIQLSLSNREFVTTIAIFLYSGLVSVSALIISVYSIYFAIAGFSKIGMWLGIFLLLIIVVMWIIVTIIYRKLTRGVSSLNNQYQEIHKTLHPKLFKEGYFH